MWGVHDAVAVQMAEDAAAETFNQTRRQQLGIEAILHSPKAAVQALGVSGSCAGCARAFFKAANRRRRWRLVPARWKRLSHGEATRPSADFHKVIHSNPVKR